MAHALYVCTEKGSIPSFTGFLTQLKFCFKKVLLFSFVFLPSHLSFEATEHMSSSELCLKVLTNEKRGGLKMEVGLQINTMSYIKVTLFP